MPDYCKCVGFTGRCTFSLRQNRAEKSKKNGRNLQVMSRQMWSKVLYCNINWKGMSIYRKVRLSATYEQEQTLDGALGKSHIKQI